MTWFVRAALLVSVLLAGLLLIPGAWASAPTTDLAYLSVTGSGSEFRFVNCLSADCALSTDVLLTTDSISAYAIAHAADQKAMIVYSGWHGAKRGLFFVKCASDDCSQRALDGLVSMSAPTGDVSLTLRSDGTPFITYFNTTDNRLHSYACSDVLCKEGKDRVLDSVPNNGGKSVVKMAPSGFPAVLYWGATTPLHFMVCHDADCVSSTTTTLSNAMYTTDMDFAYGTDGLPVVTFDNLITGALRITHCGNVTCSQGNATKLIGYNATGARLVINRPGTPFFFYVQQSAGGTGGTHDMKAMKCTTFTCTGPNWNMNHGSIVMPTLPTVLLQANGKPILIFSHTNGWDRDIVQWTCTDWQCSTYTSALVTSVHNGLGFSRFDVKATK